MGCSLPNNTPGPAALGPRHSLVVAILTAVLLALLSPSQASTSASTQSQHPGVSLREGVRLLHEERQEELAEQHVHRKRTPASAHTRTIKDHPYSTTGHPHHQRVHLCHLAAREKRGIVAGATKHDATWMHQLGAMVFMMQSQDPTQPHYYDNGGYEAGAYLQFIVSYYDCLPEVVAFVHGHQEAWHSSDMRHNLATLRWEKVQGHTDLNRIMPVWTHQVGNLSVTPSAAVIAEQPHAYNGSFNPYQIWRGKVYEFWDMYVWYQQTEGLRIYDMLLGPGGLGPIPPQADFVCCAQFVVDRATIRRRPLSFWQAALAFTEDNDVRANHYNNKNWVLGDVFVTFWALILGKDARASRWGTRPDCEIFNCEI